eukprot:COSAG04_NODE_16448_length_498_cov_3.112782_1_plen_98_part_00
MKTKDRGKGKDNGKDKDKDKVEDEDDDEGQGQGKGKDKLAIGQDAIFMTSKLNNKSNRWTRNRRTRWRTSSAQYEQEVDAVEVQSGDERPDQDAGQG